MMNVSQVSKISGVSIRTLHYYDSIGLLKPAEISQNGYRKYDDEELYRLQIILMFRELEFSLSDIKRILNNPNVQLKEVISEQKKILEMKKQKLEKIIAFADKIVKNGGTVTMDFTAFNNNEYEKYRDEVKEKWGDTSAFAEYEKKQKPFNGNITEELMCFFAKFGEIRHSDPKGTEAKSMVGRLQAFITENFYTCTNEILSGLGQMYVNDERFKSKIDEKGGEGTSAFVSEAIKYYCNK